MRRVVGLILLLFMAVMFTVSSSVVRSQDEVENEAGVLISAELLNDYLNVQKLYTEVELTRVDAPSRTIESASDSCTDGVNDLPNFSQNGINYLASDSTTVTGFGISASDPSLAACMTGNATNTTGYRSAWYRFVAPASGMMRVETLFNGRYGDIYDTVVAIYAGTSCASLSQLACNDDSNGLLSQASVFVIQDQVYYIEVADHNLAVDGDAKLNMSVLIESQDFSSTAPSWNTNAAIRSRHATAIVGDDIYVFGGQTVVKGVGAVRTARVDKFNTVSGEWTSLADIPSTCAGDLQGYSNTDAVYVSNVSGQRIFLPSGYVGSNGTYAGNHCIYDIDNDSWSLGATAWANAIPATFVATAARDGVGYFVTGGLTGRWIDNPALDNGTEVRSYFPNTDSWIAFPNLPTGRYAHTAALLGSQLCVMGGLRTITNNNGNVAALLLSDGICLDINDSGNGWQPINGPTISRFDASSAVGPDGRWYIWGGVTGDLSSVKEVEVYDAASDSWETLDGRYYLDNPARSWARGGFVNDKLWVIGGETNFRLPVGTEYEASVTGIVERLEIPLGVVGNVTPRLFLPLVMTQTPLNGLLPQAARITMNTTYVANFDDLADVFDVYDFVVDQNRPITLKLSNIPGNGDNYDLYLYDANKLLIAASNRVGSNDELITTNLDAGGYFIIVVAEDNFLLSTGNYHLSLSTP